MSQELLERFSNSSGYLKPYEGDEKISDLDEMLVDDLVVLGATL